MGLVPVQALVDGFLLSTAVREVPQEGKEYDIPRGSTVDWALGLLAGAVKRFRCVIGLGLLSVVACNVI